jgi:hypothetical protein
MRKLLTTLVCAFAVLAFANTARAQNDDVLDGDHIDDPENGKYVFWDEEEMMKFLAEYNAALEAVDDEDGGGVLDSCDYVIPPVTAVSTYHVGRPGHWHVDTNVQLYAQYSWPNPDRDVYRVCTNGVHMYANVAGLKVNWKTTSADACDYCDWETWDAVYMKPSQSWNEFTTTDCSWAVFPYHDVFYWGQEPPGDAYFGVSVSYQINYQYIGRAAFVSENIISDVISLTSCP